MVECGRTAGHPVPGEQEFCGKRESESPSAVSRLTDRPTAPFKASTRRRPALHRRNSVVELFPNLYGRTNGFITEGSITNSPDLIP